MALINCMLHQGKKTRFPTPSHSNRYNCRAEHKWELYERASEESLKEETRGDSMPESGNGGVRPRFARLALSSQSALPSAAVQSFQLEVSADQGQDFYCGWKGKEGPETCGQQLLAQVAAGAEEPRDSHSQRGQGLGCSLLQWVTQSLGFEPCQANKVWKTPLSTYRNRIRITVGTQLFCK